MGLSVGDMLSNGAERAVAPNGCMFMVIFGAYSLVDTVALSGLLASTGAMGSSVVTHPVIQQLGAAVPTAVLAVFVIGMLLVSFVLHIAALRTFVGAETAYIPSAYFTRNIGPALAYYCIAIVIAAVLFVTGLLFLIVPGIIVLVGLWFFDVFIAVEDENSFQALGQSWKLTRGHRLSLFLIGLGVYMVSIVLNLVSGTLELIIGSVTDPVLFMIPVQGAVTGIFIVFMHATTAQTYNRLKTLKQAEKNDKDEHDKEQDEGNDEQGDIQDVSDSKESTTAESKSESAVESESELDAGEQDTRVEE